MKNMTRGILLLLAAFTASTIHGGQPVSGVAGVGVLVKQTPGKRAVTDAKGNFALDSLPPGSYTLSFRALKATETKNKATDKVTVATSYSINIQGTQRPVTKSDLTSDRLIAGVDVPIQVAATGKVRGQVTAGEIKRMVWIAAEPGSHIPGRWVPADSPVAARRSNTQTLSREEMTDTMNRGNANMTDPRPENPSQTQTSPR
jgi:hypothetical protein